MKSSHKPRKLKNKVWLLYITTFALIGGIVTLFISNAQNAVIKNLKVAATTPTSVSLTWDANALASQPGGGYYVYRNGTKLPPVQSNSYTDPGLTQNVSYKYSVSAFNGASETTQSPTVVAIPTDNPPAVSITAPTDSATVKGPVTITANATDDVSVSSVQFLVDGTAVSTDTSAPYSYTWDTSGASNNKHQLTAIATDSGGHKTTSAKIAAIVDNAKPTVSFVSPTGSNTQVSGNVAIEVKANDDNSVAGVTVQLDGQNLAPEITKKPYKLNWDSTKTSSGPHTLTATARDGVGNVSDVASLTVKVSGGTADATAPNVSLTNPKKDQTISGTVTVSANASDNVGISKVVFVAALPDPNPGLAPIAPITIGTATSAPYSATWDTTKVANSNKWIVSATAYDAAGNNKTDSANVTVKNSGPDSTAPTVSVVTPNNGAKVNGKIDLIAHASDNVGVVGVQFKLDSDSNNVGTEVQGSSPYKTTLDTGPLTAGDHNIWAVARDAAGNSKPSDKIKITVKASADKSDPTVANISPADKSYVKGNSVTLKADATDNVSVAGVQFTVDNTAVGSELTAPTSGNTYQTSWTGADGGHTLKVTARDGSGNTTTKTSHFTIDNTPPTVSFTAPKDGATVNGNKIKLSVNAKDNGQVASVEYRLLDSNGTDIGQLKMVTKDPFTASWDTTSLANAKYSIKAIATDAAGLSTPTTISVTVNNSTVPSDKIPPSVPAGLAATTSSAGVSLSWQASTDNDGGSGVAGYIVYRDGKDIKHVTTPGYVDTDVKAGKQYKYKVSAFDNNGNESKASAEIKVSSSGTPTATLSITAPANGASVKGDVTATANAASDASFVNVQFTVDGKNYKDPAATAPYTVVINTSSLKDGKHSLGAFGTDSAGHKTKAKDINFDVDNNAPTVSITAPKKDQTVKGKVTLKVNVSDKGGVDHVQYLLDGNVLGSQAKSPFNYQWDSRTAANGTHTLKAIATDKSGNPTPSADVSFKVQNSDSCSDTQAPTVPAGLAQGELNPTTVTFSWQASTDSGCAGLTGYIIYRNGTQIATTADTNYTDSNLQPSTAYSYTVAAFDNSNNQSAQSSALSITTTATSDNGPVVVFAAPQDGDQVSGTVTLIATATDDQGIAQVEFKENGATIGSPATSPPYSVGWDTTQLAAKTGTYTITATATDTTGHISTATIHLKVDNQAPTVAITAPKDGAKVNGKVNIQATVTDNDTDRVNILIDDKPVGLAAPKGNSDKGKKYQFSWQSNNYAKGTHTIKAVAVDRAGNSTTSTPPVTVTTTKQTCNDTTAPATPADFKVVSSTTASINLQWGKVKDQGCAKLSGYAIYRDGDFLTALSKTNYVDNDVKIGTGYRYTVAAIDKAGNLSDQSPVLVGATKQRPGAIPGDLDFDGHVNGRDVSILLSSFKVAHDKRGDANLDGLVDGADVSVVLSNFGKW